MKCENCNWEWDIEKDDENPYLCHQCGYDTKLGDFDMESFHKWLRENRPYDEELKEGYQIRTFYESVDNDELVWHRDKEDRIIEPIGETDWLFQHDNEIPIKIEGRIYIPKNKYHRIIKGSGELKIKLRKL